MKKIAIRTYSRKECVVFLKTNEAFGGLSNMAGGYPLNIAGIRINTSEALYQACRFPHLPDIQRLIISQSSPMTAKMRSKPYREQTRDDWLRVRVRIMKWCLRVKLMQNWAEFGSLLLSTNGRPIVEESRKDSFWGAISTDEEHLSGANVLGRLLMELRDEVVMNGVNAFKVLPPPVVENFNLMNNPISEISLVEASIEMGGLTRQRDIF
ncbi:DUF1768 domain-containing protein [Aquipseudomonas alcaligenes]|uniref:DUF1768 domain-containing protein n=1 Tax=Aquipseudomonas alcaligenes TaxID=43263 RepID=A0A2V4L6D8_AQUAC|nr:NADAR family protein [Pseudomonas alcaligenes]PYC27398.1 DUF1768 domain-containing protein [Pseudomonas alcaligenes]